jgi:hypothetical protein
MPKTHRPSLQEATSEVHAACAPLSRRGILRWGLGLSAGAAALTAGGLMWLRRSPVDLAPLPAGLSSMSASQYHVIRRLSEILLPTEGSNLYPLAQVPVAAHVDALLSNLHHDIRRDLGLGIALFDNAAIIGHGSRFVDLSDAQALSHIDAWLRSGLLPKRAIGFALTKLTQIGYWMDERTWAAIEYDGPLTGPRGIPALGNRPLPN